jgi:excisionase family DNA binding protein
MTRNDSWLTVREAAGFMGVSEPTLRKWTDSGRIPVFRTPGGHRRYLQSALEEFRRSREDRADIEEDAGL